MPNIRMKRIFLRGLLWLYFMLELGYMALSLEPGFLDFDNLPDTNFSCVGKVIGGYYADLETNCQMFHVCTYGQQEEPMDIRFLCLNGTVFDQETRVCERIDEVDCSKSEHFYGLNLELYRNTQPATLEGSPETEQPLIIKSTTTTTTTTTPRPKVTNSPFYTTAKPPTTVTQQFSLGTSSDIRFNPEEINISLHSGAPPDIRTNPANYQQQTYSDNNNKVVVTTHSENSDSKKVSVTRHSEVLPSVERAQAPVSSTPANKNFQHPTPSDINYEFTFRQTEPNRQDFRTELPQSYFHSDFHSDQNFGGHHHNPQSQQFKSSTFRNDFTTTTKVVNPFQQKVSTTVRNNFLQQSLKPPEPNQQHHYTQHQTEKPQRVQLPLPLLPTLPPLTFSSPAPFSLQSHIDAKRYTKNHPSPPRIVISASASVSDASGRRLNYSLGTIGAAEILEQPQQFYDEYKDEDVGLDPFYHDVPKLGSRTKREAQVKHTDIIKSEEEAVNVLKFLFDWYKSNERTATESTTVPTVIVTDAVTSKIEAEEKLSNTEVVQPEIYTDSSVASKESQESDFKNSDLFNKNSKYNIIGNFNEQKKSTEVNRKRQTEVTTTTTQMSAYEKDFLDELFGPESDYVNDNFEPIAFKQKYGEEGMKNKEMEATTKSLEDLKRTLPQDYVDDNIEPIYFRDPVDKTKHVMKKVLDDKYESTITPDETTKENSNLNQTKLTENSKEKIPQAIGDTETNDIKQNVPKHEVRIETSESSSFSEPKSEILELVTTEKAPTTSTKTRTNHRRGRKRYYNTIEKEKEPENKNVVLEKITERAHTAKDDFNYLRTLYKVLSTTPTSILLENKSSEDITSKGQKDNDYVDSKEASPSDKVIHTLEEQNAEEVTPTPLDVIPIVTTESTIITSERSLSSDTTTETITPPIVTTEASSSATTAQKIIPTSTTTETTTETNPASTDTIIPSTSTTSEIVSLTERTLLSRKDGRRRGKNRQSSDGNQRNHRRRRPERIEEVDTSSSRSDTTIESSTSSTEQSSKKITYTDIVVEENGSNINRNIIPYPKITTEFAPHILPEGTEFLTQLTLNYKKIFEDIIQTSAPVVPQLVDVSTLPVTETYENFASTSAKILEGYKDEKSKDKFINDRMDEDVSLLQRSPTTTKVASTAETTLKAELTTTPASQLKNEDHPEETTTVDKSTTVTESFKLTGQSLETIPTTLLFTERPSNNEEVTSSQVVEQASTEAEIKIPDLPVTTEVMLHETKPVETTSATFTTTEIVTENPNVLIKNAKLESEEYRKEDVHLSESMKHEETYETTAKYVEKETSSIPKITEIFNISTYSDLYETTPITFATTENSIGYTDIFGKDINNSESPTQRPNEENLENPTTSNYRSSSTETRSTNQDSKTETRNTETVSPTANYPTTIYVLRTAQDSKHEIETQTEDKAETTENYPSTVLLLRTTPSPKTTLYDDSNLHTLPNQDLQKLIEEIEGSTKSVVATTSLPVAITNGKSTDATSENANRDDNENKDVTTTERREHLEELTSLFQYITGSTTSETILATPREEVTESTRITTTTEVPPTNHRELSTAPSIVASDPDLMSTSQIERLTITETPLRTTTTTTTTTVASRRGGGRRRNLETRRHRFSTESFTKRPEGRKQTIEQEILDELTKNSRSTTTESSRRRLRVRPSRKQVKETPTDAPLQKSASPTQPERVNHSLHTTPLSKEGTYRKYFIFNCFGKKMDQFYPDPRDCRLFHYCTQGYNKNQLIDMKFVCDLNTYFDDVKLICSKRKPKRCL